MIFSVVAGLVLLTPPKFSFYENGPYDGGIPRPDSILGYELGSRHTNFRDQERVVLGIAQAARAKVVPIEYGKTAEGRTLRVFAVSSAENIKRLEEIRKDHLALANPEPGVDLAPILKRTPAIVWINECIHGDETASFESGMALLYNLAAAKGGSIKDALENTVVIVNPVYNPDGHERYVVAYNSIPNGSPEGGSYDSAVPSAFYGRANHFRFDMNRDRVSFSQDETKAEVALFLKWNPQVYVDQHGQVATYFFPPNQLSQNVNVDRARVDKWTDVFGRATASAFDSHGWTYFVKDTFDLYYPGYTDTSTTLMGAIGMTHETDGGRYLVRQRPDETLLTLKDGAAKHFTSALAVIEAAGKSRAALLDSYTAFKKKAMSGEHAGKFQRVVVESKDRRPLLRLQAHLSRAGIVARFSTAAWKQDDTHDYWTGAKGSHEFPAYSLVIDMAQSQGPFAKALLEPGSDFEPEFMKSQKEKKKTAPEGEKYPGPEEPEFYDTTAWSLPYAYDLKTWWCESAPKISVADAIPDFRIVNNDKGSPTSIGLQLPYTDQQDILAIADLLTRGIKVSVANKPMKIAGETIVPGTFMILAARNEDGYEKIVREVTDRFKLTARIRPLTTSYPDEGRQGPGSESIIQLRKPKIGVVMGTAGNLGDVGPIWFLMEREFGLPFTPLSASALSGNLDKYTCIVIPGGVSASASGNLRDWVQKGGCLVALDGSGWALGTNGFVSLDTVEADESLAGSLFRAELDPRSFLSFGYPRPEQGKIELAVPMDGSSFFKVRKEGGSVVSLPGDEKVTKLLSGWAWDSTEKDLRGTVFLQDAPVGQGHAVIFTHSPMDRVMWPGLNKLVLNAMIIGPGA